MSITQKLGEKAIFQGNLKHLSSQQGIALMLILWVMALLSVIVAEFAFSMRTELKIAGNFKEESENYYRAQAAIQQSMTEILNPNATHHYLRGDKLVFGKKEAEEDTDIQSEGDGLDTIPKREDIALGNGFFSYRLEDEEGKIYLNRFRSDSENNRQVLVRLLEKGAGMGDGVDRDTVVDSIMDWIDKDDLHKINGAEDDYYLSLSPPYECKDGNFDTVNELLMVKGVTAEILFGGDGDDGGGYPGIAKFLTVWGNGRFNRYTADSTAIAIVYGDEAEDEIELYDEFGEPKEKYKSAHFSIIGRGNSLTGAGQRLIKAVVAVRSKNKAPALRIMYWNDNLLDYSWSTSQNEVVNEEFMY